MERKIILLSMLLFSLMTQATPSDEISARVANILLTEWFPAGSFGGTADNSNPCQVMVMKNISGYENSINFTVAEFRNGQNYREALVLADEIDKSAVKRFVNSDGGFEAEVTWQNSNDKTHLTIGRRQNQQLEVTLEVQGGGKNFKATCITSLHAPSNLTER